MLQYSHNWLCHTVMMKWRNCYECKGTTVSYTHLDVYKRQVLDYINKPVNPDALRNLLDNVRRVVEKKTLLKKQLQSSVFEKVIENGSSEMGLSLIHI